MQKTTQKRSARLPFVRLTPEEKEQIRKDYLASPFTNQSAYMRYKLLDLGDIKTERDKMKIVLLLGSYVDRMKELSRHFVEFYRFRKEENNGKLPEEDAQFFALILKSIQEINAQFDKR